MRKRARTVVLNRISAALRTRAQSEPDIIEKAGALAPQNKDARYRTLLGSGKWRQKAITAVAREMLGFIWAILREHSRPGSTSARKNVLKKPREYVVKIGRPAIGGEPH
jgi:hypothetical protein